MNNTWDLALLIIFKIIPINFHPFTPSMMFKLQQRLHGNMKRRIKIIIGVIAAAIVIPSVIYAISPLFINTTVNEPLPSSLGDSDLQKFMNMNDEKKFRPQIT